MANILIDTGYWFAHFDSNDDNHHEIASLLPLLEANLLLIPWPTLYETINTKFSKSGKKKWLVEFERIIKRSNVRIIDDVTYKEKALALTFDRQNNEKFDLSLVDNIIREMLIDPSLRIKFFITFNQKDFRDICSKKQIQIN